MRTLTLGRHPEMGIEKAHREAATVLARLYAGEETRNSVPWSTFTASLSWSAELKGSDRDT